MNGKIIAVTAVLAVCIALSGCKSNQSETVIETSSAVSVSEASETSETTETTSVTTVTATAESSETTVSETSETVQTKFVPKIAVPKVELSDLKAVYGEKLYSTPECKIIHDFIYENEEDFPAPEHIALARKAVFADEECMDSIKQYNDEIDSNELGFLPVETEEDLPFVMGASYDFDGDGENESVVSLDLTPAPTYFMDDGAIYYIDGENVFCLSGADGGSERFGVYAFDFGAKTYIEIIEYAGATTEVSTVYCTDGGTLEPVIDCGWSGHIDYRDGVFYYGIKYDFTYYPIVFCNDGKFRQLGIKEITEDDFAAHLENGREYLDYLKSEKTVTGIYTMGYYRYQIDFDDDFVCFYIDKDGKADNEFVHSEIKDGALTEETDYDIDVFKLDVIPYSK